MWEYLRDRWLSHRVLAGGYDAVVDAACAAWNALLAEQLFGYPAGCIIGTRALGLLPHRMRDDHTIYYTALMKW